ncbi:MAG: hypothetical protein HYY46_05105 [Deltaproteobacteria bacterium]|nr:hypothetical protein [Deltaproteobacteria bacterium]
MNFRATLSVTDLDLEQGSTPLLIRCVALRYPSLSIGTYGRLLRPILTFFREIPSDWVVGENSSILAAKTGVILSTVFLSMLCNLRKFDTAPRLFRKDRQDCNSAEKPPIYENLGHRK